MTERMTVRGHVYAKEPSLGKYTSWRCAKSQRVLWQLGKRWGFDVEIGQYASRTLWADSPEEAVDRAVNHLRRRMQSSLREMARSLKAYDVGAELL